MSNRLVVYRALFGHYDILAPGTTKDVPARHVAVTDQAFRLGFGWIQRPATDEVLALGPRDASRYCKFFPHRLFPDADVSVYLDGNIVLKGPLATLLDEFRRSGAAIGLFRHPWHEDVYQELEGCRDSRKLGAEEADAAERQLERYGLERGHGLTENSVIIRDHRHPGLDAAMELWWSEYREGTRRDQLSLPWVLRETGLPVHVWPWNFRRHNRHFKHEARHYGARSFREELVGVALTTLPFGSRARGYYNARLKPYLRRKLSGTR